MPAQPPPGSPSSGSNEPPWTSPYGDALSGGQSHATPAYDYPPSGAQPYGTPDRNGPPYGVQPYVGPPVGVQPPPPPSPVLRGASRVLLVVLALLTGLTALAWIAVVVSGLVGDPVFTDPPTSDAGRDAQRLLTGVLAMGGALLGAIGLLVLRSGFGLHQFRPQAARGGRRLIGLGALLTWIAVVAPYALLGSVDGSDLTRPMLITAALLTIFTFGQAVYLSASWVIFGLTVGALIAKG